MDDQLRVAVLYRRYGRVIFRRCMRLLKDPDRARDATQDIFVKVSDHLDEADVLARNKLSWLYGVATYHCLDVLREQARRQALDTEALSWDLASVHNPDLADRQLAARVLARFDRKTQAVAIGVLVDGMDHQEVASALGLSPRTVSRKLDRFLEGARKYIARSDA